MCPGVRAGTRHARGTGQSGAPPATAGQRVFCTGTPAAAGVLRRRRKNRSSKPPPVRARCSNGEAAARGLLISPIRVRSRPRELAGVGTRRLVGVRRGRGAALVGAGGGRAASHGSGPAPTGPARKSAGRRAGRTTARRAGRRPAPCPQRTSTEGWRTRGGHRAPSTVVQSHRIATCILARNFFHGVRGSRRAGRRAPAARRARARRFGRRGGKTGAGRGAWRGGG